MGFDLLPLHKIPKYSRECADVLNEEWKRSLTARLHTFEKSRDEFPVNLVLLENAKTAEAFVVGHSRLSLVQGQQCPSCLVESVIIRKKLRGTGLGRILMEKTEEFAKRSGLEMMYLTTHDKEKFYSHLGYEVCSPIVFLGSDIIPEHLAAKLMKNLIIYDNENTVVKQQSEQQEHHCGDKDEQSVHNKSDSITRNNENDLDSNDSKRVPQIPAPPSAPLCCPAPPPPPPVAQPRKKSDISRFDPSKVIWMKKSLK
ncbi:NAA80-like protein [Mya arenaria]|uniref:NAA80-like protein n=1 Tax=Mya arenaria TaxID=6604 RepID=A0ABY7FCE8_MYAAR|nr:N-alpha-acetyltransferase 80-like [Mya arenaria]WAR19810.1 NAA80-like protein [Mya arenaria]